MFTPDPSDGYDFGLFFMQSAMYALAVSIASGAPGERATMLTALIMGSLLTGITCPLIYHWVDHPDGWAHATFDDSGPAGNGRATAMALASSGDGGEDHMLAGCGAIDLGSATTNIAGGATALALCMMLGPRIGRYNADGTTNEPRRQSIAIQASGVFFIMTAYFAFAPILAMLQSGAYHVGGKTAVNIAIAASTGGGSATIIGLLVLNHCDVLTAMSGIIGGLAAALGCCPV
ncbi:unnamed protein product, partial [Phaeothamnion confervicola]